MALHWKDGIYIARHGGRVAWGESAYEWRAQVGGAVHAWAGKILDCPFGLVCTFNGRNAFRYPSADNGVLARFAALSAAPTVGSL